MIPLLQFAQFTLDTKVSLQTVIGLFVWVVSFIVFMTTVRDDIKTIKEWAKTTQRENDGRDAELQELGRIAERQTTLMEAIQQRMDAFDKRVDRIEGNCDRRHGNGRVYDEPR